MLCDVTIICPLWSKTAQTDLQAGASFNIYIFLTETQHFMGQNMSTPDAPDAAHPPVNRQNEADLSVQTRFLQSLRVYHVYQKTNHMIQQHHTSLSPCPLNSEPKPGGQNKEKHSVNVVKLSSHAQDCQVQKHCWSEGWFVQRNTPKWTIKYFVSVINTHCSFSVSQWVRKTLMMPCNTVKIHSDGTLVPENPCQVSGKYHLRESFSSVIVSWDCSESWRSSFQTQYLLKGKSTNMNQGWNTGENPGNRSSMDPYKTSQRVTAKTRQTFELMSNSWKQWVLMSRSLWEM